MITISNQEVKTILSSGKKKVFSDFVIIYKKNRHGYPRFAFIASKKFSKRAVDRNRAKRLLRELVRKYFGYLSNKGFDIIFIARKPLLNRKLQNLESEFLEFLKDLNNDSKVNNQTFTSI
ncbi:MAG: ribonuclease P protein component [Aquificae bacterium]|nr:ribonuclease P protein component [Aquificota bacterium]